jgi:magnesium transporter
MRKKFSIISPEIKQILRSSDAKEKLNKLFRDLHPHDIFTLVEGLPPREIAEVIIALGRPRGIELFEEFKTRAKRSIFRYFSRDWMADIFEEMAPDERVDFIKSLPKIRTEEVLPLVAQAERNDIKKLLAYREGTAGSILTTEYASLPPDITVREALERLKLQAPNRETIYYIYIVDDERKLLGIVSLKNLIVAKSDSRISEIMHREVISVGINEDKENVARMLSDYDFLAIPVVDNENKLMGIVTVDDVVDVVVEENTEDMLRYGAVSEYIDYLNSNPLNIAKQRILWLTILIFVSFVSAWIMGEFSFQLQAVVALTFFIPVLLGSGGNAGTQASTVVVRGLATGELKIKDFLKVLKKEVVTGVMLGVALGGLTSLRALIMNHSPRLGFTVAIAMVAIVTLATSLGALLPMLFKKLKLDPALMSGPFIASVIDVASIFMYLKIATLVFR